MDDKDFKSRFSFDPDEIFRSDHYKEVDDDVINSLFAKEPEKKDDKPNFVVNLDENLVDSLDYDFEAFSSSSDRKREQQKRDELIKKFGREEKYVTRTRQNKLKRNSSPVQGQEHQARSERPVKNPVNKNTVPESKKTAESENTVQGSAYATVSRNSSVKQTQPQSGEAVSENPKRTVRMRTRSHRANMRTLAVFIAIVLALTLTMTTVAMSTIEDIFALNGGEEQVTVQISEGKTSLSQVIDALHDAGLIKQKLLCNLFARFRHFHGYTDSKGEWHDIEYISGVYYLEKTIGLEGMLNTIRAVSTGAETVKLTFPEGWTITQIFEKLEKNGVCEASKLYANLEVVAKQYDFYFDIKANGVRYLGVEGYLFPDTYEFYKSENAVSVLKKLFDNSEKKWSGEFKKKAKELGMTRDQILIVASIIQKEAAGQSQMADVASVIYNRLKSPSFPKLECDSTLDYVINSVKPMVDSTYAQIYADSYNTRRVEGLPPGPICNPGLDAIEAALNPNETNYYFFCHNNKGKIYLSSTYAEFQSDYSQVLADNR